MEARQRLRPNEILLQSLFVASVVVGSLSGLGLVLAAVGVAQDRGWRSRWGMWLPTGFGLSIVVGTISFVLLVVSGID
jgi:hypothetical protein